jgi:hypothetical protein
LPEDGSVIRPVLIITEHPDGDTTLTTAKFAILQAQPSRKSLRYRSIVSMVRCTMLNWRIDCLHRDVIGIACANADDEHLFHLRNSSNDYRSARLTPYGTRSGPAINSISAPRCYARDNHHPLVCLKRLKYKLTAPLRA